MTGFLIAALHYSTNAVAALPAACFQSADDYELYLKYGDERAPYPPSALYEEDEYEYSRQLELHDHGPARKKAIVIRIKQTQSADRIKVDASGSTTPSGKKDFAWGGNTITSTTAEYSTSVGTPGSYSNVQLKVMDPVCGFEATEKVRVTSQ